MSWPAINFDSYKKKIIKLYQNDITRKKIVFYLLSSYDIYINIDILQYHLNI